MKKTLYPVLVLVWLAVPLMAAARKNDHVGTVSPTIVTAAQKNAPVLSSVSPTSAVAGGGSFTLTATGSNFSSASIVQWNGASIKITRASATQLCASVPSADIARAGKANITVYNPGKLGGTSRSVIFTITTPSSLKVSTLSVPSAIVHSKYSANLSATGGAGAYTWSPYPSGEALPPGLQLTSTGTLTGTPTTAGTYPFGVQVRDSANHEATKSYSMTVTTPLVVSTLSVPSAIVRSKYSANLTATGGTGAYTWSPYPSGEALPPGLQLTSIGTLTGTPTTGGTYPFGVQVIDAGNNAATKSYSMAVVSSTTASSLEVLTLSVPGAIVGSKYSANLTATGGTGAYTWSPYPSGEALPPGLQLTSIGTLTGTPTTAGTYPFGVQVIDSANNEATQSYNMTVASSTAGCGAGTNNSQCGNVSDPYAGHGAPTANATITSCGELNPPSSGYVYRLTADIGSDPTTACLTWYYSYPFVLDLNGYTVTGMIAGAANPYGFTIMNGTVNCNSVSTGCIDVQQGNSPTAYDSIHHLTLNQAALGGRCINFNQENAYTSVSTRYIQIYNVQGTLPNSLEGDDRSYLIWVDGAGTVPAEVWNATVSPGANLNAFQGITMYQTVGSYVHNNYIVLPPPAYDTGAYDTDRAILFDCEGKVGSPCGSNVAAYNQIVADYNRSLRVRAEVGDVIHDNAITDCRYADASGGCIHIGDTDADTEATAAEIYSNTIELNSGYGIMLGGSSYEQANVHDNTVTCYQGNCSNVTWFALTLCTEPSYPHPIAAGSLRVKNTTFPSNWGSINAVMSCGPPGNAAYTCGDPSNVDAATVTYCNTGTLVGNGTMTQSCP